MGRARRLVAVLLMSLMVVVVTGGAASATNAKEKVACLFYQTFAERDITDCFA
jgi:hypothetical protein